MLLSRPKLHTGHMINGSKYHVTDVNVHGKSLEIFSGGELDKMSIVILLV